MSGVLCIIVANDATVKVGFKHDILDVGAKLKLTSSPRPNSLTGSRHFWSLLAAVCHLDFCGDF